MLTRLIAQGVTFKMCTDPNDVNGWTTCTTNPDTESELFEIDCEVPFVMPAPSCDFDRSDAASAVTVQRRPDKVARGLSKRLPILPKILQGQTRGRPGFHIVDSFFTSVPKVARSLRHSLDCVEEARRLH